MNTAIKPKALNIGRQFDEHAKRYVMYSLSDLVMPVGVPIWAMKYPQGRIVLLESCDYKSQVIDEESATGSNGIQLGTRTMGTSAQVSYLMGSTDGTGWMERGMTFLDHLTNVDPYVAMEVEELVLKDFIKIVTVDNEETSTVEIPFSLLEFKSIMSKWSPDGIDEDSPIRDLAIKTHSAYMDSINRAISFCNSMANQLEKELMDGRSGKMGIKSLSENQKFYFKKVERPLPDERAGSNMGVELSKVLAPILNAVGQPQASQESSVAIDIEMEALRNQVKNLEKTNAELSETVEELTKDA